MKTRFEYICADGKLSPRTRNMLSKQFRSPLFASLGLRPIFAQHTQEEDLAIRTAAGGRRSIVEIGVAEGASAASIRQEMAPDGTLYLIDPFHLRRWKHLNGTMLAARTAVSTSRRGRVVWIQKFSQDAVSNWRTPIDLLFLDGDHSEQALQKDWCDWHGFLVPGGTVLFHDARVFEGGWTTPDDGAVKVVNALFRHHETPEWRIREEVDSLVIVERIG